MKTQIKTEFLLNLINPFENGLFFKSNLISLDLHILQEYVDFPKKNKIFQKSDDITINFYKNAALYIINSLDENKCISLDFTQTYPIQEGVFEYVKALYFKQENIYLSFPENEDNLIFVKNYQLSKLSHTQNNNQEIQTIELAKDIELAQLNSFFSPSKSNNLFSKENISSVAIIPSSLSNTVVEDERFFWKEDSSDLYSDPSFILSKIKHILTEEKQPDLKDSLFKLKGLFNKINADYIFPETFQEELIDLLDKQIPRFLPFFLLEENKNKININLKSDFIQSKLLQDINNEKFHLLDFIFSHYIKEYFEIEKKNHGYYSNPPINPSTINKNYDLSKLINMPETINYLVTQRTSTATLENETSFCLIHAYDFFNEDNKKDEMIVKKFISSLSSCLADNFSRSSHGHKFLKLHADTFNDEACLDSILPFVNLDDLKKKLKRENATNTLLNNPDYLLRYASQNLNHVKNKQLSLSHHILQLFYGFVDPKLMNQEYLLSLSTLFPPLLKNLLEDSSGFNKAINPLFYDIDFLRKINQQQKNASIKDFPPSLMKRHLSVNDDNLDNEKFKLQYVLAKKLLREPSEKKLFHFSEIELKLFNAKYNKLDYLYFNTDSYAKSNLSRSKKLFKIQSISELELLLKNIQKISITINEKFDSRTFYKELNPILKKQLKTIELMNQYGSISYYDLDESLQFNKKLAIDFISRDLSVINQVPHEFFNDVDFSLSFAKIMDQQHINLSSVPIFISKFFENQGVKDHYYDYLKSYIGMNVLKNNLFDKETDPVIKKNKI